LIDVFFLVHVCGVFFFFHCKSMTDYNTKKFVPRRGKKLLIGGVMGGTSPAPNPLAIPGATDSLADQPRKNNGAKTVIPRENHGAKTGIPGENNGRATGIPGENNGRSTGIPGENNGRSTVIPGENNGRSTGIPGAVPNPIGLFTGAGGIDADLGIGADPDRGGVAVPPHRTTPAAHGSGSGSGSDTGTGSGTNSGSDTISGSGSGGGGGRFFRGNVLERERREREEQKNRWRRDPPEFFISM
jgi:hypothetical protein